VAGVTEVRAAVAGDADRLAQLRWDFRVARAPVQEDHDAFLRRCADWMRRELVSQAVWRAWVAVAGGEIVGQLWVQTINKMPNPIGERDKGLNRGRNVAERHHEVALRLFDTLTNRPLVRGLEELALTDVLEVRPDKVDFFTADSWRSLELVLRFFVFSRPGADDLVLEGFGLLLVQDLLGIRYERLTLFKVLARLDREAKVLSAVPPVEDMRLLGRVVPLDERLAAPGPLEGQCIGSTRRSGHDVGLSCKVWT